MRKFLLFMLGVLVALPAIARDFTYEYKDHVLTYTVIDEDAKTCKTKYNGEYITVNGVGGKLEIPAVAEDGNIRYSVTEIGKYTFSKCVGLTSVTIPNSVTKIDDGAFYGCSGLIEVNIPNSVTTISLKAFYGCSSITGLSIPNSVTSIESNAFSNCSSIKEIRIEDGTEPLSCHESSFDMCPLETVYIGRNLPIQWVGSSPFDKKTSLTNLTIGTCVTLIAVSAFEGCSGLKTVSIPNSVMSIESNAFSNCSSIKEIRIEDGTEPLSCESSSFYMCPLETVYIGRNLPNRNVGKSPFCNKTSLTNLTIGTSVTLIAVSAFEGCSGLKTVSIPYSVTEIAGNAFKGCSGLTEVAIPDLVASIGGSAFALCSGITEVSIPNSVTSIGGGAFNGCNSLKEIWIEDGTETLSCGESIFLNCPLETVYLGRNLSYDYTQFQYGNTPFNKQQGITKLTLSDYVTSINTYAFYGCSGLTAVAIPNSVTSIGKGAFEGCRGLTSITIPSSVTSIKIYAFYRCSGLKEIRIEDGTETLSCGDYLFRDCPIETVYLGRNLSYSSAPISNVAVLPFYNKTDLTNLTIGNSVTEIAASTFRSCTAVTKVVIPPSVKTIANSAFESDSKLTSIIIGSNVKRIGAKAFYLCPAQTVSITAQIPPTATDETFYYYTGALYVQGQTAANAYSNAEHCWNKFTTPQLMIEPTDILIEGDKTIYGQSGDTFQLTAKLLPENVTLPQIFWRSTNPNIATVDANGIVTLHTDMNEAMAMAESDEPSANSCRIIAESLYADGPVAEIAVPNTTTGIKEIIDNNNSEKIDYAAPVEVYNLQGVRVSTTVNNLSAGLYIVRQGNNVKKIAIN